MTRFSSIARRFIILIVLTSSAVTLGTTSYQLYVEYGRDVDTIETELSQIAEAYKDSVSLAVWLVDTEQVNLLADSILQHHRVTYVEIRDHGKIMAQRGKVPSESHSERVVPLASADAEQSNDTGTLKIVASHGDVYQNLVDRAFYILLSNAFKTFLVAFVIYVLFSRLIGRHLGGIAAFARELSVENLDRKFALDRTVKSGRAADELDDVAAALNRMSENLKFSVARLEAEMDERRLAESRAREAEVRFHDAIGGIPDGVALFDSENRFVLANKTFRERSPDIRRMMIPGTPLEGVLRAYASCDSLPIPARDLDRWIQDRLMQRKKLDRSLIKTGDGRHLLITDYRTRDGGTLIFSSDITEHARLQEQLAQAQKMESIGQLTAGIAHDFNNLLAGLQGNLDLISFYTKEIPKAGERIRRASKVVKRGASLTNRLLTFSRKHAVEPQLTDVTALLSDTLNLIVRTIGETITIESEIYDNVDPVLVDPHQLENAVLNLAINARDAMPEGGRLKITCRNEFVGVGVGRGVDGLVPGEYVAIAVEDTGIGIPPENIDRVIDPFFTTKGTDEGSGLGLSMVHGFAVQSGGTLDIKSEIGVGTKVTLYLPRKESAAPLAPSEDGTTREARGRGETLVVVENDDDVRDATVASLKNLGYDAIDGGDGSGPIEAIEGVAPNIDLLLTDVFLPNGRKGPDIARRLLARHKDMKVLMMTGYADESVLRKDGGIGKFKLIQKPFASGDLAAKLRDVLTSPAVEAETSMPGE